jgi:hypothetical protein
MFTPEQILDIAQIIQPQLRALLPIEIAETIDRQLTELITKANKGEPVTQAILDLFDDRPELRPYLTISTLKGFTPQAGNMEARPRKPEYQCPECHKQYAELPQSRIPTCPDHPHQPLTLIQP